MFEKFRDPVGMFLSMSLGLRVLVGSVLGALGSSTLIGFLAELGAVNYALAHGARLPTEGVPFLRYATTATSLTIFVLAFFVFLVLNFFVRGAVTAFLSLGSVKKLATDDSLENVPIRRYLLLGAVPAIAATQGLFQLFFLLMPKSIPQWVFPTFTVFATALVLLLARKPRWTKWLISAVFAVAVAAFLVVAFTPSLYGRALNFARQGGGVDVVLEINCHAKTPCAPQVKGALFLRTMDSFLLRDPITQQFQEISSRSVDSIRYGGEERWGTR